jgi:hypothetical protein
MQNKWCELAYKVVRCLPNLNVRFVCDSNERSVGRKLDMLDWLFEIEMVEDDSATKVNEESPPICEGMNTGWSMKKAWAVPSSTLIRMFPSGLKAIAAIFLRF